MKRYFFLLFCLLAGFVQAQDTKITIFAAGDSTAAWYDAKRAPMTGWVQSLAEFTTDDAVVVDYATPGRSARSFRAEKRWDALLAALKPGDFVLIQFGHNDQKLYPKSESEVAHTEFTARMTQFVEEVREKGGTPILITSVSRRLFDKEGNLAFSLWEYPEWTREVARKTNTPLVDLYKQTRAWIEAAGQEESKHFFMNLEPGVEPNYPNGNTDNSHFHRDGAQAVAKMFINDVRQQGLEIGNYFKNLK